MKIMKIRGGEEEEDHRGRGMKIRRRRTIGAGA